MIKKIIKPLTDKFKKFIDGIKKFNLIQNIKNFGNLLKYLVFNTGVKLIMFGFEIAILVAMLFALYFMFDFYVNHRTGLNMILMSETEGQLNKASQYNDTLKNFMPIMGAYIGVITTLIGGISAVFVNMIAHIRQKHKETENGKEKKEETSETEKD